MLRCASFFAGVGGIDLGFEQGGFANLKRNEADAKKTIQYIWTPEILEMFNLTIYPILKCWLVDEAFCNNDKKEEEIYISSWRG